jgi:predicted metal-dependent hydrolase
MFEKGTVDMANRRQQRGPGTLSEPPVVLPSYPTTRRISFHFGEDGAPKKYFVHDNIVHSHFVAGISAAFPPGEESFIRSVRHFADRITDPVLKKRVAGFIGQESTHGQEHRRINHKLAEMGYPIRWKDSDSVKEYAIRFEKRLGGRAHLAMTAAGEHYTAVLAARVLSDEEIQAMLTDPEVRHLFNWHALEELEHKSVAFDVYRAVGGSERTRIAVMAAFYTAMIPVTWISLIVALARDRVARRQPVRLAREWYGLFITGPIFKGVMRELAKYMRPGFHPNDIDTTALLKRWQIELFGADGVLVDHLK